MEEGAELHVYDPMVKEARIHQDLTNLWEARNESKQEIESKLNRCVVNEEYSGALEGSFAAAILTDWDEFVSYDWNAIVEKMMQPAMIFDGRNVMDLNKNINQYYIGK